MTWGLIVLTHVLCCLLGVLIGAMYVVTRAGGGWEEE